MHSKYEPISSKKCLLGGQGLAVQSMHSRVELSNFNPIALSSLANTAAQTASAKGALPFKTGSKHHQKSRGKENLEVMEVPNSSSEGSGDEDFQRLHSGKLIAEPLFKRQRGASHDMGPPMIVDGAFPQAKGKSSDIVSRKGSTWMVRTEKASSPTDTLQQPNQARFCTHQETKGDRCPTTSNVGSCCGAGQVLDTVNQTKQWPTIDRDVAKRKTNSEARPSTTNKKPKDLGKQQTLYGFLAPRPAIKPVAPC